MSELTDKEMEVLIREYTRFNINQAGDVETVGYIKNLLRALGKQQNERIAELENICGAAYQIVGQLLAETNRFEDDDAERVLDMLANMKYDDNVLSFESREAASPAFSSINIPTVGDEIVLAEDWTFALIKGIRNYTLFEMFIEKGEVPPKTITLKAGLKMEIADFHLHSHLYNSWVNFKTTFEGKPISF